MAKKKETKDAEGFIEIPFGAFDSETIGWTYTIPEGFTAKIEDGKIIVEKAESEDEKIRKWLIGYITDEIDDNEFTAGGAEKAHNAIAWLEKQKEQKSLSLEDKVKHPLYVEGFEAGKEVGRLFENVFGKQKPAEWSDSVAKEMFIKALERAVEQTKKGYELTDCDKHSWWEDFKAYSGINPAVWSEEDEENFKWFDKFFRAESIMCDGRDIPQDKYLWFKSLRPLSHWKPSKEQM